MKHNLTSKIVKTAMIVVLMTISAYVKIPFPYMPLTFQFFTAAVAGLVLGSVWGTAAMLVYIAAGLLGLPVFSGLSGGPQYIFMPSFGFILAFPFVAAMSGFAANKKQGTRLSILFFGAVVGYAVGAGYEYFILISVNELAYGAVIGELLKLPLFFLKDSVLILLAASVYSRTIKRVAVF